MTSSATRPTVGAANIEVAMKVLAKEGFSIAASSLGGKRGVNIYFNTETGEVLCNGTRERDSLHGQLSGEAPRPLGLDLHARFIQRER